MTDLSHTLDRTKVTALIDQFNKMKEEGKVMDAFTFSFMGNQALVAWFPAGRPRRLPAYQ